MAKEKVDCCDPRKSSGGAMGGGAYFLAFLGAAIYYIQQADTFWIGVLGFLKALIWPLFLVYELLKYLNV